MDYLSFRVPLASRSRIQLAALQFQDAIGGRLALRGQVMGQYWARGYRLGPFSGNEAERNAQGNLDAVWAAHPRHELSFGVNLRRRGSERTASAPADSTDYSPNAPLRFFDTRPTVDYPGVYAEDKMRVWGPLYATVGGRFDYASVPGQWTADPRAALALRMGDHQTLRVATGRYHQLAGAKYLDPRYGNPDLGSLRADHLIAGYELTTDRTNVRVEAFQKTYRDLVTNDPATFYTNGGHGFARGVDVFAQGGMKWLTGWISYGYLDTRRKEFNYPREVPSPYGVRHSLSLVGTYQVTPAFHLGARYSTSTGRPYTPVTSATFDPSAGIWRPTFAEDNSGRLPDYKRLDVRVTQLFSLPRLIGLPGSSICVAYAEALNVLDIRNVLDITYSADYSRRIEQESYFGRRMVVCGFGLTW